MSRRAKAELISIGASLALIGIAILVATVLSGPWDRFVTKMIWVFSGMGVLFALPFIYIGSKRIYDSSIRIDATEYSNERMRIDGADRTVSRAVGRRSYTISRRGAVILTVIGLAIYASAAIGIKVWLGMDAGPGYEHRVK